MLPSMKDYKGLAAFTDRFRGVGKRPKVYIGRIVYRGTKWGRPGVPPQDFISFKILFNGREVWLNNYEAIWKMRSATRGYYQLTAAAEKKIQG